MKLKSKVTVEHGKLVFTVEEDALIFKDRLTKALDKYTGIPVQEGIEFWIRQSIIEVLKEFDINFEPRVSMDGNAVDISYSETLFN